MQLLLTRKSSSAKSTLGFLSVDGVHECVTLEDIVRDLKSDGSGKVKGATAIPAGTYDVIIDYSQRFKKNMLHVLNVPWFSGIRIHSGNTDADTEGCILVGQVIDGPDHIHGGSVALPILFGKIQRALVTEKVIITVKDT